MIPSQEQIHSLIMTGDVFKYAVVGFTAIESAIDQLILDSLHTSHRVEVKRLSTDLKVDLLIALGSLQNDSKGLINKLSKIRNYYAHEFIGTSDYCPPQEIISCFSKRQREIAKEHIVTIATFKDALAVSFITAYYDVLAEIERLNQFKQEREKQMLHIEALLAVTKEPDLSQHDPALMRTLEAELNQAIEEKKREILSKKN